MTVESLLETDSEKLVTLLQYFLEQNPGRRKDVAAKLFVMRYAMAKQKLTIDMVREFPGSARWCV